MSTRTKRQVHKHNRIKAKGAVSVKGYSRGGQRKGTVSAYTRSKPWRGSK